VSEQSLLALEFEENRAHLRAVAYRMLGSPTEADDAVQAAWFRLSRADTSDVENLRGWLTAVVAGVCLDMLRTHASWRDNSLEVTQRESVVGAAGWSEPEHEVLLADSVGLALLVVLDTLGPAERLAFVLRDIFAVPFDEIATIVDCSPAAARQLASRARRRVQGAEPDADADPSRRRQIVDAFLAAARASDFTLLLALLDPDVVLRADAGAVATGAMREVLGAAAVAEQFAGRARMARTALVDGVVDAIWAQGGRPRVHFAFTIRDGTIVDIDLRADPARLDALDVVVLDG
jgi:RNA polymerase sigma factor (sigma-70 family)